MAGRVVVGLQPVREALRAHGAAVKSVLVERKANPRLEALCRFARDAGVAVERVDRSRLDALAAGVRHQGVAALAPELLLHDLGAEPIEPDTLLMVLDGVTDPQNFGATLRSAVAMGATGVVWGEHHAAPLTPATFRASAGAVEHLRLFRVRSLRQALESLLARGARVVALDASGAVTVAEADLTGPLALVVGAEDEGVSRGVRRLASLVVRLPMSVHIDSLNASVAAAVALYEARRQRAQSEAIRST
jgi:23S rRNA (guanosine2251-2'-O)-methyltransferase